MALRKTFSLIVATTLACSMLFTSVASADKISEDKMKIMIAAGEMPVQIGDTKNAAEPKISKDKAIETAKKMLEDPDSFVVGYVSLNPNWGGTNNRTWNVEFNKPKAPGGNASVAIDSETGSIVNFYIWEGNDGQTNYVAKMTKAEAKVKAEEFMKDRLKEDISSYELQKDDPYQYGYRMGGVKEQVVYNFNYVKKINGILFSNYSINVGIDGENGKLRNFSTNGLTYDEKKFPSPTDVLTAEKAMEAYKAAASVKLQYVTVQSNVPYGMSKPKVILAYVPATYIAMLDAKTGKPVNYDGTSLDITSEEVLKVLNNPIPMNPDAKLVDKVISEKDAKAKAEDYKKTFEKLLGITFDESNQSDYKPYYYGNGSQDEVWSFNWNKNTEKVNTHLNFSINGKTGRLLSVGVGNYNRAYEMKMGEGQKREVVKEKVNWKQGKEKALGLLKMLIPEQYGFFVDENIKQPQLGDDAKKYTREHEYNFTRIVNGIRFRDNSINISIDRETGSLKNFNLNWMDAEFPEKVPGVTEQAAAKTYFDGSDTKLGYFLDTSYGADGRPKYSEVPRIAYTFVNKNQGYMYGNIVIDAKTGKQVDMYGNEIKIETSAGEPNLAAHWAKRSAELLIAQGILKNPAIDLDSKVTRAEAVKMMELSKGMNLYYDGISAIEPSFNDVQKESDYFLYVESALKQKIISKDAAEFKGDVKVTKAEFVKLLINLVGYSDVAKYSDIFKVNNMINVPTELTGYVAIAKVLDILPAKSGDTFNGNDEVTYGEASEALYKALSVIK
jgi:hypothetical protein